MVEEIAARGLRMQSFSVFLTKLVYKIFQNKVWPWHNVCSILFFDGGLAPDAPPHIHRVRRFLYIQYFKMNKYSIDPLIRILGTVKLVGPG